MVVKERREKKGDRMGRYKGKEEKNVRKETTGLKSNFQSAEFSEGAEF